MVAVVGPQPKLYLTDLDGNPLAGGKVYTYAAGTLTPLATYADYNQDAANTNPIELDSSGMANVFWLPGTLYDLVITDADDVELYTVSSYSTGSSASSGSTGGFGPATNIASATTVDLGTIDSHFAVVTGTTPTSGFGSTASIDSPVYLVQAQSAGWVITLGANILCPFVSGTLTSIQNDYYLMIYLGSGAWKIIGIFRGDGSADFTTVRCTEIIQSD